MRTAASRLCVKEVVTYNFGINNNDGSIIILLLSISTDTCIEWCVCEVLCPLVDTNTHTLVA